MARGSNAPRWNTTRTSGSLSASIAAITGTIVKRTPRRPSDVVALSGAGPSVAWRAIVGNNAVAMDTAKMPTGAWLIVNA